MANTVKTEVHGDTVHLDFNDFEKRPSVATVAKWIKQFRKAGHTNFVVFRGECFLDLTTRLDSYDNYWDVSMFGMAHAICDRNKLEAALS
jgi:hypothetical protein